MRILKRLPATLAALSLAALLAAGVATVDDAAATPAPVTQTQQQVQEDEPGWDCETMGNKSCGTATPAAEDRIEEDEPGFDCRFHGNKKCGVFFEGQWQLISYDAAGNPVSVQPRGF